MPALKRSRSGNIKPTDATQQPPADAPATQPAPPCAQPQLPSGTTTESKTIDTYKPTPTTHADQTRSHPNPDRRPASDPKPRKQKREKHTKLPKLPPNTTLTKRPLLHPPIPTPSSSSSSPKALYITPSQPFIPALKRIRTLLAAIALREKQAQGARKPVHASGRLRNGDVERGIADEVGRRESEGEKVYLKATGRAIPKALELGVAFQGEGGFVVRVEMGSVKAVDDVAREGEGEEEVPETRVRSVSCVTVSIGTK